MPTRGPALPMVAFAPDAGGGGGSAAPAVIGDKLMWTLVSPSAAPSAEFQHYVVEQLAEAAGRLVAGVNGVRVTLQERHAFCGALVAIGGEERRVDAVLQMTSEDEYVATDPVNAVLSANAGHVQGWRVHPTTIRDTDTAAPLGAPHPYKQMLWINQRMDGATPEFYSRNWYIHGGHLDGEEAETEETRAVIARRATQRGGREGRWYIQNRVREPITPTAWVVNGFADYLTDALIPSPGERYNPKEGLGEDSFDRWPPRVVQGDTYRVL